MGEKILELVHQMTVEEKITLVTGFDFVRTRAVERLGIPIFNLSDGPHGVRAQTGENADHLGLSASSSATCFPSGAALASSWNENLIADVATAVGEEARYFDISVMFGPAFNIKRSPLCGRSFEYFSEDPYLSGKMAAAYIRAVQKAGVAACPKHFAGNNQEDRRMVSNSVIDVRTLREIYLTAFEIAVKEGKPWSIMCAYNRLNGIFCSEHRELLTKILRDEWGFDGVVVSDFGSVSHREASIAAGMDLEMPGTGIFSDTRVKTALADGTLKEEELDASVTRILKLLQRTENTTKETVDMERHHRLAQEAAEDCIVLLKNEDKLLPLRSKGKVAVIGALAKQPRYQGGGSSHVASWKVDNTWDELCALAGKTELRYAEGYDLKDGDTVSEAVLCAAEDAAKWSDTVLLFVGLTEQYETEGSDRSNMKLPMAHEALIQRIIASGRKVTIVLSAGAPVEMPWIHEVDALLFAYTAGDGLGRAVAKIIYGQANPSGKIAETMPEKLEHNPSYMNFRESKTDIRYTEGIFVGYRYYEKADRNVLFPFGHGLSYTSFTYSDLVLSSEEIGEYDVLKVSLEVANTGAVKGNEIIQLYVADCQSSIPRPVKELKGFKKVALAPGESTVVEFTLDRRSFAFYDGTINDWVVEGGAFEILLGASSADIRISKLVTVTAKPWNGLYNVTEETTFGELVDCPETYPVICELLEKSPMYRPSEMPNAPDFLRNLPLWTLNHMGGVPITPRELEEFMIRLNGCFKSNME